MKKYECHITLSTADASIAASVAKILHWKTSEIARDPVLGDDTFYYLTSHHVDYDTMKGRMDMCVQALKNSGAKVIREKIELIVHDTKIGLTAPYGSITRDSKNNLVIQDVGDH